MESCKRDSTLDVVCGVFSFDIRAGTLGGVGSLFGVALVVLSGGKGGIGALGLEHALRDLGGAGGVGARGLEGGGKGYRSRSLLAFNRTVLRGLLDLDGVLR